MLDLAQLLTRAHVLPVLTIDRVDDALPLTRALIDGGLTAIEVTLRTPAALGAIRAIRTADLPITVGAGTVLTGADLQAAADAGATFAVSPGATPELLAAGRAAGAIPLIPGVATASDVMAAKLAGYSVLKFFPAEAMGGIATLKGFAGPFGDIRFCPTGGIDAAKAPSYRALPNVLCVGGSWMVPGDAIAAGNWARITDLTRAALA